MDDLGSDTDVLLDSVRDPIDRLYKVSTWIRSPSSRFSSAKALHYQEVDPDTQVDLLHAFGPFDIDYVRSVFKHYQKKQGPNVDRDWDEDQHFLLQRIAESNVRRRRQFAYWRKHREKLSQHSQAVTQRIDLRQSPARMLLDVSNEQTGALKPFAFSAPSITTASHLNVSQLNIKDDKSVVSVSEYAPSLAPPNQEVVDFPPPPKERPGNNFFECPYCFTICPKALLNPRAWK